MMTRMSRTSPPPATHDTMMMRRVARELGVGAAAARRGGEERQEWKSQSNTVCKSWPRLSSRCTHVHMRMYATLHYT